MTKYILNKEQIYFQKKMSNPWLLRLFFFFKIPLGFLSGMKVIQLNAQKATSTVSYRWMNRNPFGSMYFAVQGMAAEISTGALALTAIQGHQPTIAAMITGCEAEFVKQVKSKVNFVCDEGELIFDTVELCKSSRKAQEIRVKTIGKTEDGTIISTFHFTWSFKQRKF